MEEARDQVGVFGSFFDGRYARAELSAFSVLMLIQAITCLILEESQTQVLQGIFMQTGAVVRGVVANEWYTLQLLGYLAEADGCQTITAQGLQE